MTLAPDHRGLPLNTLVKDRRRGWKIDQCELVHRNRRAHQEVIGASEGRDGRTADDLTHIHGLAQDDGVEGCGQCGAGKVQLRPLQSGFGRLDPLLGVEQVRLSQSHTILRLLLQQLELPLYRLAPALLQLQVQAGGGDLGLGLLDGGRMVAAIDHRDELTLLQAKARGQPPSDPNHLSADLRNEGDLLSGLDDPGGGDDHGVFLDLDHAHLDQGRQTGHLGARLLRARDHHHHGHQDSHEEHGHRHDELEHLGHGHSFQPRAACKATRAES